MSKRVSLSISMRGNAKLVLGALAATACFVEPVTFPPLGEPAVEDCTAPGDEDGNGAADCDDPACAGTANCRATCTIEQCDGLDNDCSGTADDHEATGAAKACAARSCAEIRDGNPAAADGTWWIDPSGTDPFEAHCDMAGGGWTLVMNQVPGVDLPDVQTTVNAAAFGSLDQTYRLGNPTITAIRPRSAWKLTDEVSEVFFDKACVVDWSINYLNRPASMCTIGFTTEALQVPYNGGFINVSTRGIGINNAGAYCSMRAYNTVAPTSIEAGPATTCNYTRTRIVQLWYR
jgi:hypothetical protein